MDLLYNTNQEEVRINGRARVYTDKGMGEFGLSNIGDDTDFDLNGGKFIANKWLVRGGILKANSDLALTIIHVGLLVFLQLCMI